MKRYLFLLLLFSSFYSTADLFWVYQDIKSTNPGSLHDPACLRRLEITDANYAWYEKTLFRYNEKYNNYSFRCWYGRFGSGGKKLGMGNVGGTIISVQCPAGYEGPIYQNGSYYCNKYCPKDSGEDCKLPPQANNSCTASENPIDFIQGHKYRDESIILGNGKYSFKLTYKYNNNRNFVSHSDGYAPTNALLQPMELRYRISATRGINDGLVDRDYISERYSIIESISSDGLVITNNYRYTGSSNKYWRHSFENFVYKNVDGYELYTSNGEKIVFSNAGTNSVYPSLRIAELDESEFGFSGYKVVNLNNQDWVFDSQGRPRFQFLSASRFFEINYSEVHHKIDSIKDPLGHIYEFTYDQYFNLIEVNARKKPFEKVTLVWLTSANDRESLLASIEHSKDEIPLSARDFEYQDDRWPMSITHVYDRDSQGTQTLYANFQYDDQGRAVYSSLANGVDAILVNYTDSLTRLVTNALGKETTYRFEDNNGVLRLKSITGEPTNLCQQSDILFEYNQSGTIAAKIKNGIRTEYSYNSNHQEITRTEAVGTPEEKIISTQWHSTLDKPISIAYPDKIVTYTYDTDGNVLQTTIADN